MPPSTTAAPRRPTASASTQTVGLFYPSDRELAKKQEQEEEKKSFEKQLRDRRPLLTAVSPGKGIGSISGDFSRHDEIDCNVNSDFWKSELPSVSFCLTVVISDFIMSSLYIQKICSSRLGFYMILCNL